MTDQTPAFAGGEVRVVDGDAQMIERHRQRHQWNIDPLPPKAPRAYKLTVQHRDDPGVEASATSNNLQTLYEFTAQFLRLDYEFIRLERI